MKELKWASPTQKQDKNFVLKRVRRDGQALIYADEELRKIPKIVEAALQAEHDLYGGLTRMKELERYLKYPETPFMFAHQSLRYDHSTLLDWIKLDERVFQRLGDLRDDKQFRLEVLRQTPRIAFAPR